MNNFKHFNKCVFIAFAVLKSENTMLWGIIFYELKSPNKAGYLKILRALRIFLIIFYLTIDQTFIGLGDSI